MPGTNRLAPLLALLAVLATLSGCGSGDDIGGEIPQANAQELNAALDAVSAAVESSPQDCEAATSAADQFVEEVNALPQDAGTELKTALRGAGDNLRTLVSDECPSTGATGPSGQQPPATQTTTTEPTTTEPTTETTTEEDTTTTDETVPQGDENGGGPSGGGPPGGGPPGGGGTDGGTGGTGGGGTGDESGD